MSETNRQKPNSDSHALMNLQHTCLFRSQGNIMAYYHCTPIIATSEKPTSV